MTVWSHVKSAARLPGVPGAQRVSTRNARFQQWEALLSNRAKRQRAGEFLVQGVRPISLAVRHRWPLRALLYADGVKLSGWARQLLDQVQASQVAVSAELMAALGEKTEGLPELLAVAALPPDDLARIPADQGLLAIVLDRPASPGNIGSTIRSADAFGASGVIVTGHAADVYDPRTVRASTGSLFALPVVRVPSHAQVLDWIAAIRAAGIGARLAGTDERAARRLAEHDFGQPTVAVIGSETTGLSSAWRDACDDTLRIPITGSASSLNAAAAASIVLYQAALHRAALR